MKRHMMAAFVLILTAPSALAQGRGMGGANDGLSLEFSLGPALSQFTADSDEFAAPAGALDTTLGYDARSVLGYGFKNRYLIGFAANYYSTSGTRDAVNGGLESRDDSTMKYEIGPALGFLFGNFKIVGAYFFKGARRTTAAGRAAGATVDSINNKRVDELSGGYQIQMTYSFPLTQGGGLRIGPTLVYRKVSYDKQTFANNLDHSADYSDRAFSGDVTDGGLAPLLTLTLQF